MRALVSNNQSKLLESFNLNDVYHYNSVLFNFDNEKPPMEIIKKIFTIFINDALKNENKKYSLDFSKNLSYSYFGMYFTIEHNRVKYEIHLHTKNPHNKHAGANGLIDYYFSVENLLDSGSRHVDTLDSWDQVFSIITQYTGVITRVPVLSPYALITLVSPLENSVNNRRPTILSKNTLNEEHTKIEFEILTINAVKKVIMEFHYPDSLETIVPTSIILQYDDNTMKFNTPLEVLDFLNNLVTKKA